MFLPTSYLRVRKFHALSYSDFRYCQAREIAQKNRPREWRPLLRKFEKKLIKRGKQLDGFV